MDDPTQHVNTMNEIFVDSLVATVERLEAEKDKINGVVITSGKKTFFAGGDLARPEQGHAGRRRARGPSWSTT